jgi:hypothetical protein
VNISNIIKNKSIIINKNITYGDLYKDHSRYTPKKCWVKTSFVGFFPREGCLMLDLSTMSLFPMLVFLSLGGVFGRISFPLECHYLLGQTLKGKSSS